MARNCFTEYDMNRGEPPEEMLELLSPEERGDDGEDDPADLLCSDGLPEGTDRAVEFGQNTVDNDVDDWGTSRPKTVRDEGGNCAARFSDEDHMSALMGPTRFDGVMRAHVRDVDRMSNPRKGCLPVTVYHEGDPAYRVGR